MTGTYKLLLISLLAIQAMTLVSCKTPEETPQEEEIASCKNSGWTSMSTENAPLGLNYPSYTWTGSKLIVWGGFEKDWRGSNTGGLYDPDTNTWTSMTTVGAPSGRLYSAVIWTGSEVIVWGGHNGPTKEEFYAGGTDYQPFNDGALYNPSTNTWRPMSSVNAPPPMYHAFSAVWTGQEMIVWGRAWNGYGIISSGAYNPSTNTWRSISTINQPSEKAGNAFVWTGQEMIIWGGEVSGPTNDGKKYNPTTDTWTAISVQSSTPSPRFSPSAVWTSLGMVIWGGNLGPYYEQNGALYNPLTDSWTSISNENAPVLAQENSITAINDGFIVWGGETNNNGGIYSFSTEKWTEIPSRCAPVGRHEAAIAWTGSKLIIWSGGFNYDGAIYSPNSQ